MKKLILLVSVAGFAILSNAQVLLNETFNYNSTKLCNVAGDPGHENANPANSIVGTWYKTGKASESNTDVSLKIVSEPMFYTGYINSGVGKSVKIDNGGDGTYLRPEVCAFVSSTEKFSTSLNSAPLYYAFLLQVNNASSYSSTTLGDAAEWRDIFCISEGSAGLGNSYRGRFFIKTNADDPTKVDYSISKNTSYSSSTPPVNVGTISAGQTYLVVIKQDFVASTVQVIMNPTIQAAEPTTGWINGTPTDANSFGGTYGVALRRRSLGPSADILVAGLRVAKSYAEVVGFATGLNGVNYNEGSIKSFEKTILTNSAGKIDVFNLAGAKVFSAKTDGTIQTQLNSGLYLVRFVNADGIVSSAKIEIK